MADEKEQTFKVSDKRRYNPDGSLREEYAKEAATAEEQAKAVAATAEVEPEPVVETEPESSAPQAVPTDNIVAFPGAAAKSSEPEAETAQTPPAAQTQASSASAATAPKAAEPAPSAQAAAVENAYHQASGGTDPQQAKALFLSLLNMLAVEAAMHMGLMELQPGERAPVDLEAARQVLDIMGVLKEKTRGNLLPDEQTIFEQVLTDLRMQFVTLARSK
jgi:hypothetical protein